MPASAEKSQDSPELAAHPSGLLRGDEMHVSPLHTLQLSRCCSAGPLLSRGNPS